MNVGHLRRATQRLGGITLRYNLILSSSKLKCWPTGKEALQPHFEFQQAQVLVYGKEEL